MFFLDVDVADLHLYTCSQCLCIGVLSVRVLNVRVHGCERDGDCVVRNMAGVGHRAKPLVLSTACC